MKKNFRPKFHFTPKTGYMNDPNGLIYNKKTGEYHLFYQYSKEISYDEYFGSWVEKNWGHAKSNNLIDWEEQEIALSHDHIGLIWSGSSAIDKNNDLGVFPKNSDKEERLFCTYACANQTPINDYGKISCCLAYSLDGGETWTKHEKNPILPNTKNEYDEAFGDPKIFWLDDDFYSNGGIWVMITVLKVRIFTSTNLVDWTLQSECVVDNQPFFSECPDFFQYNINGKKKWVFSGAGRYYIVGDFKHDEKGRLIFETESKKIEVKCGNTYATQHFYNMVDDRIVQISWMTDHSSLDLRENGKCWDGYQTIPMEFSLYEKDGQFFTKFYPVKELLKLRDDLLFCVENDYLENSSTTFADVKLHTFDLEAKFDVTEVNSFLFEFRKSKVETTRITYTKEKNEIEVNTYLSGKVVHEHSHIPLDVENGKLKFRLLVDNTVFDLFINDGKSSYSQLFFPNEDSQGFALTSNGKLKIENLKIYSIKI